MNALGLNDFNLVIREGTYLFVVGSVAIYQARE